MSENISPLLFLPYEKNQIKQSVQDSKTLFWGCEYFEGINIFKNSTYIQNFKQYADRFILNGLNSTQEIMQGHTYKNIFCVLPKQKDQCFYIIAQSLSLLESNGLLVVVAANNAGGKNLEHWLAEFDAIPTSLSKQKCRISWTYKNNINQSKIDFYLKKGGQQKINVEDNSFITKPGIFGWNKIDKGSKILIQNLPNDIAGKGADFGCGYGYLSCEILKKHQHIKKIYALDADYNALQCAKENLKIYEKTVDVQYGWVDLTKPLTGINNLDWIIMNPPFHEGKFTQSSVGSDFIINAAGTLKKDGVLYMVANAHLPYEEVLKKSFSSFEKKCEEQGYKVFIAKK